MSPAMSRSCARLLPLLALAGLTLACLVPVCTCDFVDFDDPLYVRDNPHVAEGLSPTSLRWAWTDWRSSMYAPVTRTSFLLDHQLYGLNPHGYHLTNLLLHLVNVLLLFELLRAMTGGGWPGFLVAACFAVHPLHVESVAWITERKDVLSVFSGLLALAAWLRFTRCRRFGWLLVSLTLYLMSLLAKPMLVTLPFMLLLLDHWPLRRMETWPWRKLVVEKVPFLLLAAAAAAITAGVHHELGAMECLGRLPLGYRLANAAASCGDYLLQTACPIHLAAFYPHPLEAVSLWKAGLCSVLLVGLTFFAISQRKSRPWLLTGWLWFLVTLVPVSGLVAMGGYARADRYTYVPHIGLFLGLVWGLHRVGPCWWRSKRVIGLAAGGVLAVWGVLTWRQALTWRNSTTLWEQALRATGDQFLAHAQLGPALEAEGKTAEAAHHFRAALRLRPDYLPALLHLGALEVAEGRFGAAEPYLRGAVAGLPADPQLHFLLGATLEKMGRWQEAADTLEEAVRLDPDSLEVHLEFAAVLERLGRFDEAEGQFRAALQLDPRQPLAHTHLGAYCERAGKLPEAEKHLRAALESNPEDAEALCNLGVVLDRQGRLAEAERALRASVRLAPGVTQAWTNLGIVRERQGKRPSQKASGIRHQGAHRKESDSGHGFD
jgi:Flp pilus assembly protein TadD